MLSQSLSQPASPVTVLLFTATIDLRKFDIAAQASLAKLVSAVAKKHACVTFIVHIEFPIRVGSSVFGKEREIVRNHHRGADGARGGGAIATFTPWQGYILP